MIWRQKARIDTRSYPQFCGPSEPMSTGPPELRPLVWSMERKLYCHQKSILNQLGWRILIQKIRLKQESLLDANLLEERYNTALSNVHKYQAALKKYYNKSVVQGELNIGDLVMKKDIRTKDKHKFSTPWKRPFIIVDVAALGAYVLAEVDGGMLPNT
jgi:hypothetical protein